MYPTIDYFCPNIVIKRQMGGENEPGEKQKGSRIKDKLWDRGVGVGLKKRRAFLSGARVVYN